jgi:hypothetical protein
MVDPTACPGCGAAGKVVKIITLKALLTPAALASLATTEEHRFCPHSDCDVVYFSGTRQYHRADVKVPVFQKELESHTPACSCFGHTRADLAQARTERRADILSQSIQAHIRARRCGGEVNNPQGSCCLGNVNRVLRGAVGMP